MRRIKLGSLVGCLSVLQVDFVRKQTMCKAVNTHLTVCLAFSKPRWFLLNTTDRAETVFGHLKVADVYFSLFSVKNFLDCQYSLELSIEQIVGICFLKFLVCE